MSKFNAVKMPNKPDIINKAGGESFSLSVKEELVTLVLTSFLNGNAYETDNQQLERLKTLIVNEPDKLFIAKLAVYARNEYGLRSVSHVIAGELSKIVKGEKWTKVFFNKVIFRPDDMTEILSYLQENTKDKKKLKKIPNSLKKGFSNAFKKFDSYQLAKYKNTGKSVSLKDVVSLIHPKPSIKNGYIEVTKEKYLRTIDEKNNLFKYFVKNDNQFIETISKGKEYLPEKFYITSLEALVLNLLKNTNTWESKISHSGQEAKKQAKEKNLSEEEKQKVTDDLKKESWIELIENKKIGYLALLRNLRNILEQSPDIVNKACELLVNGKMILKSKIFPFQYLTAIKEISQIYLSGKNTGVEIQNILKSINTAMEISLKNVPKFEGKTLIALDTSGSMTNGKNNVMYCEIGALFALSILKANNNTVNSSELMTFDTQARYVYINSDDTFSTSIKNILFNGGGTDFNKIFQMANKGYDRIIIISDMQGWIDNNRLFTGNNVKESTFKDYKKRSCSDPYIFSLDLTGNGSSMFPDHKTCLIAGFSNKIFDVMKNLEVDKNALISQIEAVEI